MTGKIYRPCVVAAFINDKKELLVGRRKHLPAAWQLPQGGIEENERPDQAVFREVKEELGIEHFSIIRSAKDVYFYDFPKEATFSLSKKFAGQRQHWFLCHLISGYEPDLSRATDDEFDAIKWLSPKEILEQIIDWKKEVYERAFLEFALLP